MLVSRCLYVFDIDGQGTEQKCRATLMAMLRCHIMSDLVTITRMINNQDAIDCESVWFEYGSLPFSVILRVGLKGRTMQVYKAGIKHKRQSEEEKVEWWKVAVGIFATYHAIVTTSSSSSSSSYLKGGGKKEEGKTKKRAKRRRRKEGERQEKRKEGEKAKKEGEKAEKEKDEKKEKDEARSGDKKKGDKMSEDEAKKIEAHVRGNADRKKLQRCGRRSK